MTHCKYHRLLITHGCVLAVMFVCACILSWMVWQRPDEGFYTVQALLYPIYRWVLPFIAFGLCVYAASSPLVWRVLRLLKRESMKMRM